MGLFGKKKTAATYKIIAPEIQVMMLGARRVGKTSMLASMYNSFSNVAARTNLLMSKKGGIAVDQSLEHMKALFRSAHIENDAVPTYDYEQTKGFDKIDFMLSIAGKKEKPRIIRFVDCSGEWINNRTNEDDIGEEIEKSDIVIIAIDTVLLMEENGRYNNQNAVQSVTEFIINNMNPDGIVNREKMVLFVPTKCEKYYHQNKDTGSVFYQKRMTAIADRIKDEYAQLLNFLTSPNNKKFFTVGILPVITLGGIEFDEFTADNDKEILTGHIQYRYCKPNKFAPEFCDRPLIYSMLFVQKKIFNDYYKKAYDEANKGKKKVSATIIEWFQDKFNIPKDMDYINELNKVAENLSTVDYPGFIMIQDPESIEMKAELNKRG